MTEITERGSTEWDMRVLWIPTDKLHPSASNPNEQDDATFNALVESIQTDGWTSPAQVVPIGAGEYEIVAGEHRWRAAKVLQSTVPCVVLPAEDFHQDRRDWAMVKDNILKGSLNPEKFSKLYDKLATKYDAEVLQTLMGFTSADAFQKVYREAKAGLPPELQQALEDAKEEIKTIDDLSRVLNRLFMDHGETLPSNMMVFSFGGRDVLWVRAGKELWQLVSKAAKQVGEAGGDMEAYLLKTLQAGVGSVGWPADDEAVDNGGDPAAPGDAVPQFTEPPA